MAEEQESANEGGPGKFWDGEKWIDIEGLVNGLANDTLVVHLAGAETITGAKTFNLVGVNGNAPPAKAAAIPSPATVVSATATALAVTPANASYTQADQTALANEVIALRIDVFALVGELNSAKTAIDAIRVAIGTPGFGITA